MLRILSRLYNNGRIISTSGIRKFSSDLYEPDYLKELQPQFPIYQTLNIQLKGYDYPILENYQKLVHKIAENMNIDVDDAWAIPPQILQISTYKPQSEVVKSQYKLNVYERMLKIRECSSLQFPILLRALEASLPMGVTLNIIPHETYHEEIRYIPDTELIQLKQELDDLGGPVKKK